MKECSECTDFLDIPDFRDRLVCPICYSRAVAKKNAAINLLKEISTTIKDSEVLSKIKTVIEMRNF